eukprot:6740995-Alexandrium_andersonii.AAC.1
MSTPPLVRTPTTTSKHTCAAARALARLRLAAHARCDQHGTRGETETGLLGVCSGLGVPPGALSAVFQSA